MRSEVLVIDSALMDRGSHAMQVSLVSFSVIVKPTDSWCHVLVWN